MQDLTAHVLRLLEDGESQRVEFKTKIPDERIMAKEIVAFANAEGGTLIIGVGVDGAVIGVDSEAARRFQARLIGITGQLGIQVRVYEVRLDGLPLVVVEIPEAPAYAKPLRVADGYVYRRKNGRVTRIVPHESVQPGVSVPRRLRVFVAMSFRFDEEPALVDYYEAIKRAIDRTGLQIEAKRIDLMEGDYEITTAIGEEIIKSDFVIADFTLNSPNVYYEAGIAKGAGKYIVRCARRGTELPFDLRTHRVLMYSNATQLERSLIDALPVAYAAVLDG
ncbi:AlbA family DNA-binding domain-containing protein [Nonomuraea sp. NPDC003201]